MKNEFFHSIKGITMDDLVMAPYVKEDKRTYSLKLSKDDTEHWYHINKSEVKTKDELLWWVCQLSSKGITEPHCIYQFIKIVCKNTGIRFGRNEL